MSKYGNVKIGGWHWAFLPANWTLQEIYCDGTGTHTTGATMGKATITRQLVAKFRL